jgi:hypothetical protein
MMAPSQVPLIKGKWQRIAGNAVQALITGPKRRYAVHGGHRFYRDRRDLREQTAPSDNFVQLAPAFIHERSSCG